MFVWIFCILNMYKEMCTHVILFVVRNSILRTHTQRGVELSGRGSRTYTHTHTHTQMHNERMATQIRYSTGKVHKPFEPNENILLTLTEWRCAKWLFVYIFGVVLIFVFEAEARRGWSGVQTGRGIFKITAQNSGMYWSTTQTTTTATTKHASDRCTLTKKAHAYKYEKYTDRIMVWGWEWCLGR